MSNNRTTHEEDVYAISRVMATIFAITDAIITLGLGYEYVLPVLLHLPNVSLLEVAAALTVLVALALMQLLLLPVIFILAGITE